MSKPSFLTDSFGRRSLSIAVVCTLALIVAASGVAASQDNGAGDRAAAFPGRGPQPPAVLGSGQPVLAEIVVAVVHALLVQPPARLPDGVAVLDAIQGDHGCCPSSRLPHFSGRVA